MASRSLAAAQQGLADRAADRQRAAEIAAKFTGWLVWSSRDGRNRIATRSGDQQPPDATDSVWAKTVVADSWPELVEQLAEQAAHDAG